jgi:site-specific DNA recombinase
MRPFFAYIRVSTVKQGERGVSLQEQTEAITRYANKHNLTITEWFEERETAAKRGRPLFTKMLRLLQKTKVEGVIIHKIDRSARNLRDWAELGELIDQGVAVHFANENLDLYSRGGRLSADIQAVVAADYIRNLREEVKKGFYGRLKQGYYPLPAPIGYLDKGKAQVKEIDQKTAPLIKKVFELYGSAKYSIAELVEEAYKAGLRSRNGNKIGKTGLSLILTNPFYLGLMRIKGTAEYFEGLHQPLISKSLFDRVQLILQGKALKGVIKHDYLFRRLLKCKTCKYSLIAERQKGHIYYRCHTKNCPTTTIREEIVENTLQQQLQSIQFTKEEEKLLETAFFEGKTEWFKDQESIKNGILLNIAKTKEQLKRLTDAFLDTTIDVELFTEKKQELLLTQKEWEEKLEQITAKPHEIWTKVEFYLELAKTASIQYELANEEKKRELVEILTSNRLVSGKSIDFTWSIPFNYIAEREKISCSGPSRVRPRTFSHIITQLLEIFTRKETE